MIGRAGPWPGGVGIGPDAMNDPHPAFADAIADDELSPAEIDLRAGSDTRAADAYATDATYGRLERRPALRAKPCLVIDQVPARRAERHHQTLTSLRKTGR